ncbi:MAG: DUF2934 domain-containing protein [Rhodospirillaceae bacterium]
MTTARKSRSTTAARKPTDTDANSEKKTNAVKSAGKAAKTTAKKAARSQETNRVGASVSQSTTTQAPAAMEAMSHALQGGAAPSAEAPTPDILHRMIAEAAYYRAERRGFAPGGEEMDWFEAEAELRGIERRV